MAGFGFDDLITPLLTNLGSRCVEGVELRFPQMLDTEWVQKSFCIFKDGARYERFG